MITFALLFPQSVFFKFPCINYFNSRKINIWAAFIILSPYLGPLLTAFIINTQKWNVAFGVYTAITGLCLIMAIMLVDETYYDRRIPADKQPEKKSRLMRLIGVEQFRTRHLRNTFGQAVMRPVRVFLKPTVFLSTVYYCFTFAWVVGINTTLSIFVTPLYNFGPKQIGKSYIAAPLLLSMNEQGFWLILTFRILLLHPRCCCLTW